MNGPIPAHPLRRAMNSIGRIGLGLEDSHADGMQIYVRLLGVVYAVAFLSLAVQVRGLIGSDGILPAAEHLRLAGEVLGDKARLRVPTLFWIAVADPLLVAAAWAGAAAGLAVAVGLIQGPLLLLAWALYLSLVSVGQVFLNYQWDMLLLEAGFLAPWVAPWRWRVPWRCGLEPSPVLVRLHWWLLFRLMFAAGWVKVQTDPVWRDLTALDYHFWTQPLPTWTAWWMQQTPGFVRQAGTAATLAVELIAPWLIFAGRRGRWLAFGVWGGFQILIAATGNYGFFNLLAFALGVPLLGIRPGARPMELESAESLTEVSGWKVQPSFLHARVRQASVIGLALLVAALSALSFGRLFRRDLIPPYPLDAIERELAGLRIVNGYGLFADMTEDRPEIRVEVSDDGLSWMPIRFRWKPGDPERRPRFTFFHMPRLDWQMWFEGLHFLAQDEVYEARGIAAPDRQYFPSRWFQQWVVRLLEAPNAASELTAGPRRTHPPLVLRARVYRYRFASADERRATGAWWQREFVGEYLPGVRLRP